MIAGAGRISESARRARSPDSRAAPSLACAVFFALCLHALTVPYFAIKVIDESTGRGVPLVELETVSHVSFFTDSNGLVALDDPDLMGRRVFFFVRSHGYLFQPDGLGSYGRALDVKAGGSAELKVQRVNIAERLYRMTGESIYRDSRLLGGPAPAEHNGQVAGQDSMLAAAYAGRIFWLGGDTMRLAYPLGHFRTCGATTPADGLDPDKDIPLHYFTGPDGFSRGMWPLVAGEAKHLLMWTDGLLVAPDASGRQRLIAHYEQHRSLAEIEEHGLGIFNDKTEIFDRVATFEPDNLWRHPRGHPVTGRGENASFFLFRASHKHHAPFPAVRVKATLAAISYPASYEAFTCRKADGSIRRDTEGRALWAWTHDAAPLTQLEERALVRGGQLREEDTRYQVRDLETRKPIELAAGSVRWNEFRGKWVLIAQQRGGTSFAGEIWFSEAEEVTGPWRWARKIVTHERQTFYNPVQHGFLDREGGRFIYFEGTYSNEFSGNHVATPRYQYNQMMYRLDLADPRLARPLQP